ncbi:MAG: hypothetical protein U9Q73_00245 [Nanoarchaeota archaeon]|nr:hypothetical protein [Nanoarchaeota archaeon]
MVYSISKEIKMNNQKYPKMDQINQYAGYLKSGAGGFLVQALVKGDDVQSGIGFGLYLVGDIVYRATRRGLNNQVKSELESKIEKE